MTDPMFIIFTISNILTSLGFNVPFIHLPALAHEAGLSKEQGARLLSIIGGANLVGRIVLGYLADKTWVNRLWVYNTCLTLCGIGKIDIILQNWPKIIYLFFFYNAQLLLCHFYVMISRHLPFMHVYSVF